MKKKFMKKALALATALTMIFSVNVYAAGEGDSTITGDSDVKNPIYNIVLPTVSGAKLTIDPFEQLGATGLIAGSKLSSAPISIFNLSNVPVAVTVNGTVQLENDVESVDAADVTDDITKKQISIGLSPATGLLAGSITGTAPNFTLNFATNKPAFATADVKTAIMAVADAKKAPATLKFLLKGAVYNPTTSVITGNGGVPSFAVFTYNGDVSPGPWAVNDVKVALKFNVVGIPESVYTANIADAIANAANTVALSSAENVTAPIDRDTPGMISGPASPNDKSDDMAFRLYLGDNAKKATKITKISIDEKGGANYRVMALAANASFSYTADTFTLLKGQTWYNGLVSGKTYVFTFTFDTNAKATYEVTIS